MAKSPIITSLTGSQQHQQLPKKCGKGIKRFCKIFDVHVTHNTRVTDAFDKICSKEGQPLLIGLIAPKVKASILRKSASFAQSDADKAEDYFRKAVADLFKDFAARQVKARDRREKAADLHYMISQEALKFSEFEFEIGVENVLSIGSLPAGIFYSTKEWRAFRSLALGAFRSRCVACGFSVYDGVRIHVDHIKPRHLFPEFSFRAANIQTLCESCHAAKPRTASMDWRPQPFIKRMERLSDPVWRDVIDDPGRKGISNKIKETVRLRHGDRCVYCADKVQEYEFDHLIPVSKGGITEASNIVLVCVPCNRSKGAKTLKEWMDWKAVK